ncbi:TPA: hypothetical protein ACH3X2_013643 [Trebouxia sp. C0005]
MPSLPLLQHGPTVAYHRALAAASQPYPSPPWHSSPSTPWHTHAAASGSLATTPLTQPPAAALGQPPAAALRQLPATAPAQISTTGPLHPNTAPSELPHVSASQMLPAQSHLVQKSASAASPHLPLAPGSMDLGQHAQTHMQAKLAQQQAIRVATQMPIDLGQHARTHMQAKLAQQQAILASTQLPEVAAVPQAVEVSEAASAAVMEADQHAGQPELPAQLADSGPFQRPSKVKPVSPAATTREAIRALQPPSPLSLTPALASVPDQSDTKTGATVLVEPQARQQPQQLCDRTLVPKLQPRAVTLARQTSLAGSAEPSLQTPAPVSNQLNAQPDMPSPAVTSAREAPEQLSQPACVQQQDDKPSSEQIAEKESADTPTQELAQLLVLKRRELSQQPLQKLPQAHQKLQGHFLEQPHGLLPAQPPGQLHLSLQGQCKVHGKPTAADAAGWSTPAKPACAVAGRQGSVKVEADTELLHNSSSQSAVELSPLDLGTSPSDQNITQVPDHKGHRSAVSAGSRGRTRSCRSYKHSSSSTSGRSCSSRSYTNSSSSSRSTSSGRSTLSRRSSISSRSRGAHKHSSRKHSRSKSRSRHSSRRSSKHRSYDADWNTYTAKRLKVSRSSSRCKLNSKHQIWNEGISSPTCRKASKRCRSNSSSSSGGNKRSSKVRIRSTIVAQTCSQAAEHSNGRNDGDGDNAGAAPKVANFSRQDTTQPSALSWSVDRNVQASFLSKSMTVCYSWGSGSAARGEVDLTAWLCSTSVMGRRWSNSGLARHSHELLPVSVSMTQRNAVSSLSTAEWSERLRDKWNGDLLVFAPPRAESAEKGNSKAHLQLGLARLGGILRSSGQALSTVIATATSDSKSETVHEAHLWLTAGRGMIDSVFDMLPRDVQYKLEVAVPAMFQKDDVCNLGFLFGVITLEPTERVECEYNADSSVFQKPKTPHANRKKRRRLSRETHLSSSRNSFTAACPYKAAMCRRWVASQSCRFGARCHFAHGQKELQAGLAAAELAEKPL